MKRAHPLFAARIGGARQKAEVLDLNCIDDVLEAAWAVPADGDTESSGQDCVASFSVRTQNFSVFRSFPNLSYSFPRSIDR